MTARRSPPDRGSTRSPSRLATPDSRRRSHVSTSQSLVSKVPCSMPPPRPNLNHQGAKPEPPAAVPDEAALAFSFPLLPDQAEHGENGTGLEFGARKRETR